MRDKVSKKWIQEVNTTARTCFLLGLCTHAFQTQLQNTTVLNYDTIVTLYVLVVFGFLSLEDGFVSFCVALGVTDLSVAIVSIATNLNAIRGVSCATYI